MGQGGDVNAQGGGYGNALQAAASGPHEAIVKLFLARGADVNAQGGNCRNTLRAAYRDDEGIAMLLEPGADQEEDGDEDEEEDEAAIEDDSE